MGILSGGDFERLFAPMFEEFRHTALRFEIRERYNVPIEREPLRRFLAGEAVDAGWFADWLRAVATATAAGRRFMRVRAVSVPFSEYTRFGLAMSAGTVAAGEDIRYLARPRYEALGLPHQDAWLFDSSRLGVLHFDEGDQMLGGEIVTDPATVRRYCQWRDVAWRHAVPRAQFISRHRPR